MALEPVIEIALHQSGSALTDYELVAGVAGNKVLLHWVFFSSSVAGTVTIEAGTATRLWEMYPDDNGGAVLVGHPEIILGSTTVGQALTVTTSITGAHFVAVGYTRRNA